MLTMILKMSAVTILNVVLTFLVWRILKERKITAGLKIALGVFYGVIAIAATHFGIDYGNMLLNVRDLSPMLAGIFFDPVAGIIAGLIGGIERYIAGACFGIGTYTRVACSISTCIAGFFAAFLNIFIFKHKKPSAAYAFFMGAAIEVFHMYVVFVTHRADMEMAFYVVKTCSVPMIIFSGLGLAMASDIIKTSSGESYNPFKRVPKDQVPVSHRFQVWLFAVTAAVLLISFCFNFTMQSQSALQEAKKDLKSAVIDISDAYSRIKVHGGRTSSISFHVGSTGTFCIIDNGELAAGTGYDKYYNDEVAEIISTHKANGFFTENIYGEDSLCLIRKPDSTTVLFAQIPESEIYATRDAHAYETMLADILVFTVIYVLISLLVQSIVVDNLVLVNESLAKITGGDLNEQVSVYNSSEFTSLSNDINQTVDVLKGYIAAAEKRIEQELLLAHTIQDSALPKNFSFTHNGFDIYAIMDPAKEVGGDFYDFFFVESDMLAMVIADVSGKGIPASLFMMRTKTAIRGLAETGSMPAEVFRRVNNELCENNDANMFVTAWMGIIDLRTGVIRCINAGHEYPAVMQGGKYDIFRDKHRPPLGAMEGLDFEEYEMRLGPGDCLFVYTDGVPEALNRENEQYGADRMIDILNATGNAPMEELLPAVKADIEGFVGNADQFDDITMMGFRYHGPQWSV